MSWTIQISPSGHRFTAHADETVLAAAIRHGVTMPYSCRNGSCASCKGKLVEGEVDYGRYDPSALTQAERAAGMALFCQALPLSDLVIEVRELDALRDIPVRTLPSRVLRMDRVAHDVMILHLKTPGSERLQYLAGQYIDILLRNGQRRSFSIANAPHQDEALQLHVRHVPGGQFTEHVFKKMRQKDLLRFTGPLGSFFLREESSRPLIFMAGGTGLGPIKAIIEHCLVNETRRPMHLYWGVRAKRDLYMQSLLSDWVQQHGHFSYTPVLSEPMDSDHWRGRSGWVHKAIIEDYPDLSDSEVYASGPPPMVQAGSRAFAAQGLDLEFYYYDSFDFAHERQ